MLRIAVVLLAAVLSGLFPSAVFAKMKVIPLPAFSTTRNEGETYGNLTALLFTNSEGEVYAIMAPFVVYNRIMGVKTAWQLFGYMPGDRDFVAKVSYSTKINREFRLEYKDPGLSGGRFSFEGGLLYEKDSTERFFGLTQKSPEEEETNFTLREFVARFSLGLNLAKNRNLALSQRFRDVEIQRGGIDRLPFIADRFAEVEGLGGAAVLSHRLTLTHDRRDDRTTPTQGEFIDLFGELGHVFQDGHIMPFSRYGVQAKAWFPVQDHLIIFVPNFQMQWLAGSDVPFFERSTLGGEDTLRAYGLGRFVDDHFILLNFEGRIRVARVRLLDVMTEVEVAPFVDMGKVYSSLRTQFLNDWEVNPGVGMRVLVRPNVVGRLDIAFGREGITFFVGLNFPF